MTDQRQVDLFPEKHRTIHVPRRPDPVEAEITRVYGEDSPVVAELTPQEHHS